MGKDLEGISNDLIKAHHQYFPGMTNENQSG
jgi:hypothetical protein